MSKRLPTEAEWEFAARGGLAGKRFPWGDEDPDEKRANYRGNVGKTTPVGQYSPNDYGLYDMAGNVFEWCMDEYDTEFYQKEESRKRNPFSGGDIT
ncbi:SUMF1/EgtB/PvdO family nonheme iron enzyme [Candidatus Poribacteria bacterium]|nr:SUMF1/EgtB/PvdO family nonheme iron enzyme [Candidatus Poribacteria bacterium]